MIHRLLLLAILALSPNLGLGRPAANPSMIGDCEIPSKYALDPAMLKSIREIHSTLTTPKLAHKGYISPEELRQIDGRTLAELIVQRLNRECEETRTAKDEGAENINDSSELIMLIPSQIFKSILENGFKNQHATQTTGGCNCSGLRLSKEQLIAGIRFPYSKKMAEILPKYSLFNVKKPNNGNYGIPGHYGDMMLVFKKNVKKRATWTNGDSLEMSVVDPDPNGNPYRIGRRLEQLPARTTEFKRQSGEKLCEKDGFMRYCEAQIWGPLDLQDVDHIMIEEGKVIPEELKSLNIPVYRYKDEINPNQLVRFTRGDLEHQGKNKVPPPRPRTRTELEKVIATSDYLALKNIARHELLEKFSDQELKENFLSADLGLGQVSWFAPDNPAITERERYFAELAARSPTPENSEFLKKYLDDQSEFVRIQALHGLSHLPKEELKPLLLKIFKAPKKPNNDLIITAAAIGLELDDAEITQAIKDAALYIDDKAKWIERLQQKTFCPPSAENGN